MIYLSLNFSMKPGTMASEAEGLRNEPKESGAPKVDLKPSPHGKFDYS
jgi:hypothetical protein